MFEAKYNYFRMTSIVMIGISIGLHFRQQTNLTQAAKLYTLTGALLFITSALIVLDMGQPDRWFTMKDAELFSILGYTGIVLVFLGVITWARVHFGREGIKGKILRVLAACGVLSLPSYIAHGLVIPGKDIVVNLTGLSSSITLLGSLGIFAVISVLAIKKVYTLYG